MPPTQNHRLPHTPPTKPIEKTHHTGSKPPRVPTPTNPRNQSTQHHTGSKRPRLPLSAESQDLDTSCQTTSNGHRVPDQRPRTRQRSATAIGCEFPRQDFEWPWSSESKALDKTTKRDGNRLRDPWTRLRSATEFRSKRPRAPDQTRLTKLRLALEFRTKPD